MDTHGSTSARIRAHATELRKERRGERNEAKTEASERTAPARVSSPERDERGADGTAPARVLPERDERPPRGDESHGRYVPRSVRRIVWGRDGARCAYVDERGIRCRETTGLELHHRHAHALGGPNTACNLELRCQAHNALAAEADFGREHMDRMRPSGLRTET